MQDAILQALRRGATDEALAAARAAVAAAPDDAGAQRQLATVLQHGGDSAGALAAIDRAIALVPDDAGAHFDRATLLFGDRQHEEGQAALTQSIGLDPNQFQAYLVRAQLALGRGDLDEAERQRKLAARVVPNHPHLAAIEGMLALRRGEGERAQQILTAALERTPGDAQLGYALGFAYMQLGHLAFAEQAFRRVLEQAPLAQNLHALIADLMRQQGRPGDAADEIAPLLASPTATPGLRRIAGELELAANRPERALPQLRQALAAQPGDRRVLSALLEAWGRTGDVDDGRATLDAALATTQDQSDLWLARLALEPAGGDAAAAVVARWLVATPDSVPALETHMALQTHAGDEAGANATARRIAQLEPGRRSAEMRLVNDLLDRDPEGAIAHCERLLAQAPNEESRQLLRAWLAAAQDNAGQVGAAVATWSASQAQGAAHQLPLWTPSEPRSDWPEAAAAGDDAARVALLWGAPGSGVERVAALLGGVMPAFRADRYGPNPPRDALQKFRTIADLQRGDLDPEALVAEWRDGLPQRHVTNGQAVDWLLYWDNALLHALRPHWPEALLLFALRDPRDMLLDWLAYGAPARLAMVSPRAAAAWLAMVLNQVAALHERDLHPHRLIRLDAADEPQALAQLVGEALGVQLPTPPPALLGPRRFPAGHWRRYSEALAEPFALLAPVARRFGYDPT